MMIIISVFLWGWLLSSYHYYEYIFVSPSTDSWVKTGHSDDQTIFSLPDGDKADV